MLNPSHPLLVISLSKHLIVVLWHFWQYFTTNAPVIQEEVWHFLAISLFDLFLRVRFNYTLHVTSKASFRPNRGGAKTPVLPFISCASGLFRLQRCRPNCYYFYNTYNRGFIISGKCWEVRWSSPEFGTFAWCLIINVNMIIFNNTPGSLNCGTIIKWQDDLRKLRMSISQQLLQTLWEIWIVIKLDHLLHCTFHYWCSGSVSANCVPTLMGNCTQFT